MLRIITFGELMLRLQPYNYERFVQCDPVEFTFGGGDASASGLIYAQMHGYKLMDMVNFAVASSVIKHTIHGDGNITDDPEFGQSIQNDLECQTTEVHCAASVSEALDCAVKGIYCLLIIDLQVSDMDKAEMVRIFRVASHAPILVLAEPPAGRVDNFQTSPSLLVVLSNGSGPMLPQEGVRRQEGVPVGGVGEPLQCPAQGEKDSLRNLLRLADYSPAPRPGQEEHHILEAVRAGGVGNDPAEALHKAHRQPGLLLDLPDSGLPFGLIPLHMALA